MNDLNLANTEFYNSGGGKSERNLSGLHQGVGRPALLLEALRKSPSPHLHQLRGCLHRFMAQCSSSHDTMVS